jgi:hypothetical protein
MGQPVNHRQTAFLHPSREISRKAVRITHSGFLLHYKVSVDICSNVNSILLIFLYKLTTGARAAISTITELTNKQTNKHTTWIRALPKRVTGPRLVKKFPALYVTGRFITAFTSARHLSLSWPRTIPSIPAHPISWVYILILSSYPHLGPPVIFFPSGFPTNSCMHISNLTYVPHAWPISFFLIWSLLVYLVGCTDHKIPCHVVFFTPLSPRSS